MDIAELTRPDGIVPINIETTAALVSEVIRLRAALGWCVSELENYGCDEQGEYFESTVDALKTAHGVLLYQQNGSKE